ncbi:MAG: precorrin-3B synthase [Hyphomicrobiaceae bacterium]|nr:precorrin-3B synthase [Hyphomicrobiaceae bacterium]
MTSSKLRGDCPSLHRPMVTGDGLLARISPVAGRMTPQQLEALGQAAQTFGNGQMEISTRGNLQIRGLSTHSHDGLVKVVETADIDVSASVPILAPALFAPGSFSSDDEVRPHLPALKEKLLERLETEDFINGLAPKTSIIIDAGGLVDLSGLIADVRIIYGADQCWEIKVGGIEAKAQSVGRVKGDEAVIEAVVQTLKLIAALGKKARGHDLSQADLRKILADDQILEEKQGGGEHVGNEGTDVSTRRSAIKIGVQPLQDEQNLLTVALPFGAVDATAMIGLAQAAIKGGALHFLPLPGKLLGVSGLDEAAAKGLLKRARALGFVCDVDDPRLRVMTCAGAPACQSARLNTRLAAADLIKTFADELSGEVRVHVSGCDKRCARLGFVDMEIVGTSEGVEMTNLATGSKKGAVVDFIIHIIIEKVRAAQEQ